MGAEDVSQAGIRIARAASEMSSSAARYDDALMQHRVWAEQWLLRFEQAIEKLGENNAKG